MPQIHPRVQIVNAAHAELRDYLAGLQERHDLTNVELIQMLLAEAAAPTKYMLRDERHPDDPDKPAGWA